MTPEQLLTKQKQELSKKIIELRKQYLWVAVCERKDWPSLQQRHEQFIDMVRSLV